MIAKLIEPLAERAPAAMMFRSIFERVHSSDALNQIFREHCVQQVQSDILLSHMVDMLIPVIHYQG